MMSNVWGSYAYDKSSKNPGNIKGWVDGKGAYKNYQLNFRPLQHLFQFSLNFSFLEDIHVVGKKMAWNGLKDGHLGQLQMFGISLYSETIFKFHFMSNLFKFVDSNATIKVDAKILKSNVDVPLIKDLGPCLNYANSSKNNIVTKFCPFYFWSLIW